MMRAGDPLLRDHAVEPDRLPGLWQMGAFHNFESNAKLACVGDAAIRGSNNELTITGQCFSLDLAGSDNKIKVTSDFGKIAAVNISGSFQCDLCDGKPPTINDVGSRNRLTPRTQ